MGMGRQLLGIASDAFAAVAYVLNSRRPRRGLVVLSYGEVSPRTFNAQLKAIGLTRGVKIVGLDEVDRWLDRPPTRGSAVMFSFDDGLHGQLHAASELNRYGLSGTFFVPATRFDDDQLGEDGVRLLVRLAQDVQPHLCADRPLAALTPDELCEEISRCLDFCSRFAKPRAVAIPDATTSSDVPDGVARAIGERGIRLGFTNEQGWNGFHRLKNQPMRLRRIAITGRDRGIVAQAKAAGYAGPLAFIERQLVRISSLRAR
jgi:hypothetical protein